MRTLLVQPEILRKTWVYRMLGNSLFKPACWSLKPEPLARGAGLGMLVSMTPTIGIQIPAMALLCILGNGNIPFGIIAAFISNPFTMVPIFGSFLWLGCYLMGVPFPSLTLIEAKTGNEPVKIMELFIGDYFAPLWVGSGIAAVVLAGLSYIFVYRFAVWCRRVHLFEVVKERARLRRVRQLAKREERMVKRQEKLREKMEAHMQRLASTRVRLAEQRSGLATAGEKLAQLKAEAEIEAKVPQPARKHVSHFSWPKGLPRIKRDRKP